jgi:hypothetical protein
MRAKYQTPLAALVLLLRTRNSGVVTMHRKSVTWVKVRVNLSLYRPWRPLGLREVGAPTFSDIRLTDGGKVVSLTRRQLFIPRKILGTYFC